MQVTTKVGSSILIASDTIGSTAKKAENLFSNTDLNQTVTGKLEPVSTVDGRTFYYTVNGKADGDAKEDAYTLYSSQEAFATAYGLTGDATVLPYTDYVFQLKITNTEASAQDLKLTTLQLKYSGETDGNLAYRVAFFVENITSVAPTGTLGVSAGRANGIYAPSTAANQSDETGVNKAVSGAAAAPTALTLGDGSVDEYNQLTKLAEVPVASSSAPASYYKVIARLYIEGEDTTCTNTTFAVLNGNWQLSLGLTLGTATANVGALAMATTPVEP